MLPRIPARWIALMAAYLLLSPAARGLQDNPPDALLKDMRWRNIGPANMSGRISDIEALDSDFGHVIVASASGGVFKSVNAGTTWTPIFADYDAASIGDVAIFQPDPDLIWVGTGEECVRNSVAWGNGIYKSTDGGETFAHVGLEGSYTIAAVVTHPEDPDTVWVAAAGNPWAWDGQRGVFKTTDGGLTWNKLTNGLPDDERTGASALVIDPSDPDVLYAGMWQRLRQPWRFDSGGPNGGIYKTTDGGDSWKRLTDGLPEGDKGKVGLAVSRSNPDVLVAMVEHGFQPDEDDPDYTDMTKLGSGIYRSEDGGESWEYVNRYNSRPFYYSHIWINPTDDQIVYVVTGSFLISEDGGRTLERQSDTRVHGDHHALWADPATGRRFYIGTDGGAALTHDHGATYEFFDNLVLAQYYAVAVDMRDPYWVYGGLQDNGTWGGPSKVRDPNGILTDHWVKLGGGDGFHAQVDPTDWNTVYLESQGGNLRRVDATSRESTSIRPTPDNVVNYDDHITDEIVASMEERDWRGPFRFNWSTPVVLSPHNPRTVYVGGNYLFRSIDRGDSWHIISPDLTDDDPVKTRRDSGGLTPDNTGAEHYGTIITIAESPLRRGLLWVGTDDGNVWVSRNGGESWDDVTANVPVPADLWISRVEASHFAEGSAYLSVDGHRSADFRPLVFKTEDYGQSWRPISGDLPQTHPVYVIREDPRNPNLLFVGTEFGVFFSIDDGDSWRQLNLNMPTVAVHDLVVHPRDNDLVAGTHGRGVWILDDITPLQQLVPEVLSADAWLFEPRLHTRWRQIQQADPRKGYQFFAGDNFDGGNAAIAYWLLEPSDADVMLRIEGVDGRVHTAVVDNEAGINRYSWNLRFDGPPMNDNLIELIEGRLQEQIDEAEAAEEREEAALLRERLEEFRQAPSDPHRRRALRGLEIGGGGFGGGGRGGGRGGGGGGRIWGDVAPAGQYLVTLAVDGRTHTAEITIKDDPMVPSGSWR